MNKVTRVATGLIAISAFVIYFQAIAEKNAATSALNAILKNNVPIVYNYGIYPDKVTIAAFPPFRRSNTSYTVEGGGWSFVVKANTEPGQPIFKVLANNEAEHPTDMISVKSAGAVVYSIPVKSKGATFYCQPSPDR